MTLMRYSAVFVCVLLLGAGAPGQVCFDSAQLKRLELLKVRAKKYKAQVKALRAHIAKIERIGSKARIERAKHTLVCKVCKCVLPWSLLGVSVGACAGVVIGLEMRR